MRLTTSFLFAGMLFCIPAFAQLELIKDLNTERDLRESSDPKNFVDMGGNVMCFLASDGVHGQELWRTDGTEEGTWMVKDVWTHSNFVGVESFTKINGILYFVGPGLTSPALWRSDGTFEGTYVVREQFTSPEQYKVPANIAGAGSMIFFTINNVNLWVSDGTNAGTHFVKTIGTPYVHSIKYAVGTDSQLFFVANDGITQGEHLWRSDGTAAGTFMVKELPGGFPSQLFVVGEKVFFSAYDAVNGTELWKSDGTLAGTTVIKDIVPGNNGISISDMTTFNGEAYFSAEFSDGKKKLFRSNGTSAGTVMVTNENTAIPEYFEPKDITICRDTVFFRAWNNPNEFRVWKLNPATNKASLIANFSSGESIEQLVTLNNNLYFGSRRGIFFHDGFQSSYQPVAGFPCCQPSIEKLVALAGKLYFVVKDITLNGVELWITNAIPYSTDKRILKEINKGVKGSNPIEFASAGGNTYFLGMIPGSSNNWLYKTDGTAAGTVLMNNPAPQYAPTIASHLHPFGNAVLFFGGIEGGGSGLWKSTGTAASTIWIKDNVNVNSSLVTVNNKVYFLSRGINSYLNLWSTDGTTAGTAMVKEIPETSINNIYKTGNRVSFITGEFNTSNKYIWGSDGTEVGTTIVKTLTDNSAVGDIVTTGEKMFFVLYDNISSYLWVTDGTGDGTKLLYTAKRDEIGMLTAGGNYAFFNAVDTQHGLEQWRSDGTVTGTGILKDVEPGPMPFMRHYPEAFALGNDVYFGIGKDFEGIELWKTNGTEAGTELVKNIKPDISSDYNKYLNGSFPRSFARFGNSVVFLADEGNHSDQIWISDGTTSGTQRLTNERDHEIYEIRVVNDMIFVIASHQDYGRELFRLSVGPLRSGQEITFTLPDGKKYGNSPFALTAQATSGLPVSYSSSNTSVARIENGTIVIVAAGQATITASQPGNESYNAAEPVERVLTIAKSEQTIVFNNPGDQVENTTITLSASTVSQLSLSFSTSTPDVVSVDGEEATLLHAGPVAIKATQEGDDNYLPADAAVEFCSDPVRPVITVNDQTLSASSPTYDHIWYRNDIEIANSNSPTLSVEMSGHYTVVSAVGNCRSQPSEEIIVIITGLEGNSYNEQVRVYPNPVQATAVIEGLGSFTRLSLRLTNSMGADQPLTWKQENSLVEINLSKTPQGSYYLNISANGRTVMKKVVVIH